MFSETVNGESRNLAGICQIATSRGSSENSEASKVRQLAQSPKFPTRIQRHLTQQMTNEYATRLFTECRRSVIIVIA